MASKIIGVLGLIGSGKDTLTQRLVTHHGYTQVSFADSLKDVCSAVFGWTRELLEGDTDLSREWRDTVDEWWAERLGIPGFTPRRALQLIGTDVLRTHLSQDIWVHRAHRSVQAIDGPVVISDVRFQNEIEFMRSHGGSLIRVTRGPDPDWWPIATAANQGNPISQTLMTTVYASRHHSEWASAGCPVDHLVTNDGTLSMLYAQIDSLISRLP